MWLYDIIGMETYKGFGGIQMYRYAIENLKKWKESRYRKPLIIEGARQVGKTWLMKEFGKNFYKNFVYFNFDEEDALKSIFESTRIPSGL